MRASAGTPASAATTASTPIAQNAARQPRFSPTTVASGRPSRVPSIRPFITTAIARPRTSERVSWAVSEMPMPKNACAATPVTTR